jgi:hypothetical protein
MTFAIQHIRIFLKEFLWQDRARELLFVPKIHLVRILCTCPLQAHPRSNYLPTHTTKTISQFLRALLGTDNASVATVRSSGLVTSVATGICNITVNANDNIAAKASTQWVLHCSRRIPSRSRTAKQLRFPASEDFRLSVGSVDALELLRSLREHSSTGSSYQIIARRLGIQDQPRQSRLQFLSARPTLRLPPMFPCK